MMFTELDCFADIKPNSKRGRSNFKGNRLNRLSDVEKLEPGECNSIVDQEHIAIELSRLKRRRKMQQITVGTAFIIGVVWTILADTTHKLAW